MDDSDRKSKLESLKVPDVNGSKCSSRRSSVGSSSDAEILAITKADEFKIRAEELGQQLAAKFEAQFHDMIENLTIDLETSKRKRKKNTHANVYDENGLKRFVERESLLTELLEINHIQTIYNVFVALLFVFLLNTMVYDYLQTGRIFNYSNISWSFGKTTSVIANWLYMKAYTLAIYPIFSTYVSNQLSPWARVSTSVWSIAYIAYLLVFLYFPLIAASVEDLPPASTVILIAEQVRLMMKVHAFVRENTARIMNHVNNLQKYKKDDDQTDIKMVDQYEFPGFSQYLYFLFIPTLIYRDKYPMTSHIRWNFVVKNFLQLLGCIAYTYFIFARFCTPAFENTGKEKGNIRVLLMSSFSCMLPGMLVLLVAFFAILHSWMNAFAEMTRFADRMFYRDWWNSNSFSSYYRMWNVVVHDWLFAYIYKDFHSLFGHRGRGAAAISVFFISAVVHEYILAVAFRFFFPALLVMFGGVGLVFFFVKPSKGSKNPLWNIYLWVSLTMGSGILMSLYSVEWYASRNCNRQYKTWSDFILPFSFDPDCVVWEWRD